MAKTQQCLTDIETIFQAFKEGGKEKANGVFRAIQAERKLMLWETIVLSHEAQKKITAFCLEVAIENVLRSCG